MHNNEGIVIQGLSKRYRGTTNYAIKDLTFEVKPGEIYGLLGPNGAGKSTTIRTLMNFIRPSRGTARILGMDIVEQSVQIKHSVGYLASDMAMYSKMTGSQYLKYASELQGLKDTDYQHKLINRLKAETNQRLGSLSRGNRQKFAIIQAFMHKPKVIILDEPSSGLDPLMQEVFYDLLRAAKTDGAAIFMSSHIMSEVQKVCDRVGIVRNGRLIIERNINEMVKEAAHTFEITFADPPPVNELKRLSGVQIADSNENQVTIHLHGELPPLLSLLGKYKVIRLEVRQLDLEELFMHFYQGQETK